MTTQKALADLYEAYCGMMRSEFDYSGRPWTPERDNDVVAIQAREALAQPQTVDVVIMGALWRVEILPNGDPSVVCLQAKYP